MRGVDDIDLTIDAGGVARLTLTPGRAGGNTIDPPRVRALQDRLDRALRGGARALVITSGGREFCRGLDLGAALDADADALRVACRGFAAALARMITMPLPVIALVDGAAIGGGVALVAAADVVVASPAATFQLPELSLGLPPAIFACVAALRIPRAQLRRWALTGMLVDAAEARAAGLVDRLVDDGDLERAIRPILRHARRCRPEAVAACKAACVGDRPLAADLEAAADRLAAALLDPSLRRGLRELRGGAAPPWFHRRGGPP